MCDKRVASRWLEMSELCLGLHQLMSRKLRVLIVDDNSMFRRILRRMIQVYCNQKVESIHEASNPVDGLKLLGEKPFDFVFMDIDMPELSGIETTKIIRGHDPRWKLHPHQPLPCNRTIPIAAVTTNDTPLDQATYANAGMTQFLPKPFSHNQVSSLLSQAHEANSFCPNLANESVALVAII
ncbi:sensitivity to red-light reduced protein [Entomophthora muscae]|uniref:Sensitivity to red-light reduced protein n=1 Tax=Entomophthora muscae TaxID=34485 RepID=A0ACC2TRJ8_9FUNG|nr:sensitivity to red-light reduced protein [Entomophthora muscae]